MARTPQGLWPFCSISAVPGALTDEQTTALCESDLDILIGSADAASVRDSASHAASTPASPPRRTDGPPKSQWLQVAQLLITFMGVLVGSSAGIVGFVRAAPSALGNKALPVPLVPGPQEAIVLHSLQAIVILGFIIVHRKWLRQVATGLTDAMPIAKKTLEQFTAGWMWMWRGWFLLYLWFAAAAIASNIVGASKKLEAVSDVVNIASGFAIWYCYLVLEMPSVNIDEDPHRDRAFREAKWLALAVAFLVAILAVYDRLFELQFFGTAAAGLYNGLAIACLAGRLGSHYIGTSKWMLLCLYTYSILQVVYSFLDLLDNASQEDKRLWFTAVFILALVLKMVLALAGSNMMQNGGLRRYLDAAQAGLLIPSRIDEKEWQALKAVAGGASSPHPARNP